MNRSSLRHLLSASTLALAALSGSPAQAAPFSALYVFGDSLSDSGNNAVVLGANGGQAVTGNGYVPVQPYGAGTYSNGAVWASYYADILGVPLAPSLSGGGNFAFGGATTGTPGPLFGFPFDLRTQASQYLTSTSGVASPDALYVVAGGGNNARAALTALAGASPLDAPAIVAATAAAFADDIGDIVDQLQGAGAQNIVVWNTPNLGLAPAVAATGFGTVGSFLAGTMNAALATRLGGEVGVTTFDLFGFGSQIAADPAAFGFTDVANACGAVAGANCNQYAYWDGIHPTTAAHAAIAQAMSVAVAAPVPEPETWALLGLGLGALVWRARRHGRGALPRA